MVFNTLSFAIFMSIVFVLYWLIPDRYKHIALLMASWYFYMGFGAKCFLFLILATLISYFAAIMMQKRKDHKRLFCGLVVVIMIVALAYYKYANFILTCLSSILSVCAINFSPSVLKLAAPVGISFFTFKIISYMVEVRRGTIEAQYDFIKYASYVGFFPQIASGPIGRPAPFFERVDNPKPFDKEQATEGLKLVVWGLFKKIIIADKLALYVQNVYNDVNAYEGFAFVLAAFFFSIQIYCDFSGYSDMANGIAMLLGFDETRNFKQPYLATSVKDFWGRWHISLSTWFRDYIYIPLGGNRVGNVKYARNIIITFLVSGLWHGANFTFIIWGLMHGIMQVIETFVSKGYAKGKNISVKEIKLKPATRVLKMLLVFVFVTLAWIFFKANSIKDAGYVILHMFDGITSPMTYIKSGFNLLGINSKMFIHLAITIVILLAYDIISYIKNVSGLMKRLPKIVRYIIYVLFIDLIIIWFMQYGADSSSFVYFNF